MMGPGDHNQDAHLDRVLAAYRDAVAIPEPSAEFMPNLWQRIEARRRSEPLRVWRWAAATMVGASLAIAAFTVVAPQPEQPVQQSYVEALAERDAPILTSNRW